MHKRKDNPYHQLTQQERYHLKTLIETGFSVREAAKRLNRHCSTVYRELRRNSAEGVYIPEEAERLSRKRRQQAEKAQIFSPERLKCRANLLNRHWSPESISLRLRWELPSQTQTVSHTTIYRWIAKDRAALEVSFTAVSGALAGTLERREASQSRQGLYSSQS